MDPQIKLRFGDFDSLLLFIYLIKL